LAKEKAAPPVKKKVAPKEKVAEPKVTPAKEEKKVLKKKAAKAKAKPVKKKSVAKKKAKEKAAKPKVAPAKKKKKISKKKVAEAKTPSAKKKPVDEEKAESKVAEPSGEELTENPMLKPRIEKVTINMSVGQSGKPLEQAATILQQLTDQKPSRRQAKKTIREFGIRKGESIACLVTLRKEKAEEFLRKALQAVDNKLSKYCFDRQGNFSFGIKEHIDIPGTKYVPELGIHGMDISVSLGRAGYRVKHRHRAKSRVGKDHLLTADEAVLFIKDEFDVEII
jgi:large subunit ribosomal protein L5